MANPVIVVEHFSKSFGTKKAVDDLSFVVNEGDIFAFLGTNGAGKTTTIRTLLGIYEPDRGTLLVDSLKYSPEQAGVVGYLPEERGIFVNSCVLPTIIYFGQLKGLNLKSAKEWALTYLKRVELEDKANTEIKRLSSGQQQKIQIGITLIGEPKILILDEPTKGLDPLNRVLFFEMLAERQKRGLTIMLSTHHFEEIEKLCNRLLILNNGKEQVYGELSDIKKRFRTNKIIVLFEGEFPVNNSLYTAKIDHDKAEIIPNKGVDQNQIMNFLLQQKKLTIINFEGGILPLEDIFIQIAKQNSNDSSTRR